jgi:AcrR family transcriptional regulator
MSIVPETETQAVPETGTETDGRTARRDRNRTVVLDAALSLFTEDNLYPTPEQVAQRSGVSLRSLYRYFADREALVRAAIDRHLERNEHLFEIPGGAGGTLDARVERYVDARLRLHEAIGPTVRAARLRAPTSEPIRTQLAAGRRLIRAQLEHHFAADLARLPARDRRPTLAAADALTQPEALDHLRLDLGQSARAAHETLRAALLRLFGPRA